MTIDYAHPLPADLYDSATQPDVLEYIRDNMIANAKWLEGMDPAGKQTGFKRINSGLLEEWNGTAWVSKALGYIPKAGATDITGSLWIQKAGDASYRIAITDAPADKRKTIIQGASDGNSFFARVNDAETAWVAGMKIGADNKVYDVASGLPFVTTDPVGAYLPLAGGTLTGSLTVAPSAGSDAELLLNAPTSGKNAVVFFKTNGLSRWGLAKGTGAESGSNAGSDLVFLRYTDTGAYIDSPLNINRSTGVVSANTMIVAGSLTANDVTSNSTLSISNGGIEICTGAPNLYAYVDFHSGPTMIDFDSRIAGTGGNGTSGAGVLNYQAANHSFAGDISTNGAMTCQWGYRCKNGTAGAFGGNYFNIYWDGNLWIVIDNLKLKITIPAVFADEEIAKAKPQALEPKWFDTLQPQIAISSSELMPEGKLAGLIPGDPEPSLLLGQMILQIQDLKRRVSALEGV
jgi:hypothetical protein